MNPKKARFRTTDEVRKKAKDLWYQGKTDEEVADAIGCSSATALLMKRAMGLVQPRGKKREILRGTSPSAKKTVSLKTRKIRLKCVVTKKVTATKWHEVSEEAVDQLAKWRAFPFKGTTDNEFVSYVASLVDFLRGHEGDSEDIPQVAWDLAKGLDSFEAKMYDYSEQTGPIWLVGAYENGEEIEDARYRIEDEEVCINEEME